VCAVGLAAILGHVFPVYLLFRGGKGVATSAGVFLAITPIASLVAAAVFAVAYTVGRIVSIGSLLASLTLIGAVIFLDGRPYVLYLAAAVVVLIVVRHKSNIQRLINRAES
jgi:glycerol-3-phosphate acyltransferase PlsY